MRQPFKDKASDTRETGKGSLSPVPLSEAQVAATPSSVLSLNVDSVCGKCSPSIALLGVRGLQAAPLQSQLLLRSACLAAFLYVTIHYLVQLYRIPPLCPTPYTKHSELLGASLSESPVHQTQAFLYMSVTSSSP